MIIVLLMLTSAVSGFMISNDLKLPEGPPGEKGERGEDGNDGLNADETRIVELEAEVHLMSEYVLMLHEYFVIPNLDPIEYQNVDESLAVQYLDHALHTVVDIASGWHVG